MESPTKWLGQTARLLDRPDVIVPVMKFFRTTTGILGLITSLLALTTASPAFAQLYTFSGTITSSADSLFAEGDAVVAQFQLSSPLTDLSGGGSGTWHVFPCEEVSLSVAGIQYIDTPNLSLSGGCFPGGLSGISQSSWVPDGIVKGFDIMLYSYENVVTYPNGLLIPGEPISAFEFNLGRLWAGDVDASTALVPSATFQITGYQVTALPAVAVPESATYALFGATALLALVIFRRFARR